MVWFLNDSRFGAGRLGDSLIKIVIGPLKVEAGLLKYITV